MQSDKEFLRDLGKKIKELREEKNLSQQDLADMADVAKSTIQRIEKGIYNPSLLLLRKLAIGLELNHFIFNSEPSP